MKAVVYDKFGSPEVLKIEEIDNPVPKDNEVLIEVYASSVNSGDCHIRSGDPFLARVFAGPIKPRNRVLKADLEFVKNLVETNQFKPMVDHIYTMDDVRRAHDHVDKKSKQGNVIIRIKP